MLNPPTNPPDLRPLNNRVFVDCENVHGIDISVIGAKSVYFTLLMGAQQQKLDVAVVEILLLHARAVELVRLNSSGKNALDFALAYYVGRAATADPTAYFHFISKDKGFDPLIEHLRTRHIKATRHDDFSTLTFSHSNKKIPSPEEVSTLPVSPPKKETPSPERGTTVTVSAPKKKTSSPKVVPLLAQALAHLKKNTKNRPKKLQTLENHLKSLSGKSAAPGEVSKLIHSLKSGRHIAIDANGQVTYSL